MSCINWVDRSRGNMFGPWLSSFESSPERARDLYARA